MLIGKVVGDVVATQKVPPRRAQNSHRPAATTRFGSNRGEAVLALDSVDAGVGDRVLLVTEGFSAMTAVGRPNSPIDMAVIGIIDTVDLPEDAR